MKLKPRIFNYTESTYGIKRFGAKTKSERVDVTYFAKVRSVNAMVQRLLKLPHMWQASANWLRERISQGEGGMEQIITDDSIYVITEHDKVIGKFSIDNKWIPFDPPLKPNRPWLKSTLEKESSVQTRRGARTKREYILRIHEVDKRTNGIVDFSNELFDKITVFCQECGWCREFDPTTFEEKCPLNRVYTILSEFVHNPEAFRSEVEAIIIKAVKQATEENAY